MIRLKTLTTIIVSRHCSLCHNRGGCRVIRIDFRIGNQYIIRRCITIPRYIRIGVTRINHDRGNLIDRFAIFNRQVIQIEKIITVEITHKRHISTISIIGTEVHDILLEGLVSPYTNGVHRRKGSNIIRVIHHTNHEAATEFTTRIGIYRTPKVYLTLVYLEFLIRSVCQGRRSHICIPISLNRSRQSCHRSTGENNRSCSIRRIVCTCLTYSSRIYKRVFTTGIASPTPIFITGNPGSVVEVLGKRNLLGGTHAETERPVLRCLTTPHTILILAQRTDINQIELTRLEQQILVKYQTVDQPMERHLLRKHILDRIRINRILADN